MATKYTKELLEPAVASSVSIAEVMRKLGTKWSGGGQQNIKRWVTTYELDTSHFLGQGSNRGKSKKGGPAKLNWKEVLVLRPAECRRQPAFRLRRAMIEAGVPYECRECGNCASWNDRELRLQVNHVNGKWWDDRLKNVEFLCPNCHSQTEGWSGDKGGTNVTSCAAACRRRRKEAREKKQNNMSL
jgi:hypothetical protein